MRGASSVNHRGGGMSRWYRVPKYIYPVRLQEVGLVHEKNSYVGRKFKMGVGSKHTKKFLPPF